MQKHKLSVPPEIRHQSEQLQLRWLQSELPLRRSKATRQLLGQLGASTTLLLLLVIPMELIATTLGTIPVAARLVFYLLLAIGWHFTPLARKWKTQQEKNRSELRELELYRVYLTARLAAASHHRTDKKGST